MHGVLRKGADGKAKLDLQSLSYHTDRITHNPDTVLRKVKLLLTEATTSKAKTTLYGAYRREAGDSPPFLDLDTLDLTPQGSDKRIRTDPASERWKRRHPVVRKTKFAVIELTKGGT